MSAAEGAPRQPDATPAASTAASLALRRTLLAGGASEEQANGLMNGYAHELAELQRLRMDELDLPGQKARIVGRIVDLIGPEAS
jgi:hypothetical protein